MKETNDEVSISDLRQIIRSLITFIVIDGKEYVHDKNKQEYVVSYVHMLAKVIHDRQINEAEQVSFVDDIAKDISKYII